MGPVFNFATLKPIIFNDLVSALGAGQQPWKWAPGAVQSFEQQLANLHFWIDFVACDVAAQINTHNPFNRLPDEILCMIFAEAVDSADDVESRALLAQVCRHWEEVIYNNKASWATIVFDESDVRTHADGVFERLRWRMDRAAPAPLDLDLSFRSGVLSRPAEELLREHLYHVRTLALVADKDVLEQQWRTALTMPAPVLARLAVTSYAPYAPSWLDHQLPPFPKNLFSGTAPRLGELYLDKLRLPPLSWSPLRCLETFTYRAAVVDTVDLSRLVWACPSLRALRVVAFHSFEARSAMVVAPTPDHPGPIGTIMLCPAAALPASIDVFLHRIGCQDPLRFGLVLRDETTSLSWLIAAMLTDGLGELHLSNCDDGGSTQFSVTATARNLEGKTRATSLDIVSLAALSPTFTLLSELTLPEAMWPTSAFPEIPHLRALTIVLDHPSRVGNRGVSIFLLSLQPGVFWDIPSLRTLKLAYLDVDAAGEDEPPSWAKRNPPPQPLVISALEIATFLTWNLHTGHPLQLVHQNLVLMDSQNSYAMQRLRGLVHEIVHEPEYYPRAMEGLGLCNY
ncbi:hypothetical protein AURDEDRAFT_176403 [Auricularia subglabra TFB-10046 SS5]|uniref:F-box domain-containing protein n=1 Tax=Auricularia subglabra (strain TFB-10046 / SS5) TaxID=717982 RepID=J0WQ38_AURST|nr:hypothetical protein AURDEDRAFT_176403 [Auricularia subglabra TFB-10046 SS5]